MHDVDLPYLYRAVTNRCLNLLRDRNNRERLLAQEQTTLAGTARVRCDDQVIGLQLLTRLAERLDTSHMEIMVCRFLDDMSQEEIAEHLDLSRKTVGKRLQRIRDEVASLASAPPEPPPRSPTIEGAS
jgi:RNA polymerase sigma-70 factor (ECF subfamily)